MTYSFTIVVGDETLCTEDVAERVYAEVGVDTIFGACNGATYIDFKREGASYRDVVLRAIGQVIRAGFFVQGVIATPEADE